MAITTTNSKLAVMECGDYWEPGLPMAPGTLGQDDKQQLLWGYPGVLWDAAAVLAFVLDMNTRLSVYLQTVESGADLTSMMAKNVAPRPGQMNKPVFDLIDDATP